MSQQPRLYSPYDEPMWKSIAQGEMKLQRCTESGVFRYPPGPACPETLSLNYEWVPISGNAKIISWTVFHRKYLPAYPAPHLVVAIELEEGPIMVSYMDHDVIDRIRLDAPVKLEYVDHPDGYRIPKAVLAD
ncbi:Zn-ribbon domain-containing OB-fold protein [Orrella marina]|uniref:Nucleic acid-binding protein n=1 Tax=Orrella marina TaxID=2163011 RepID=A0A2R4XG15_9BURK|nr:OB-fold domain-containing protein [Orrella marina]AWB32711.1 nucleic acid-binding protein [Orrella marina]